MPCRRNICIPRYNLDLWYHFSNTHSHDECMCLMPNVCGSL